MARRFKYNFDNQDSLHLIGLTVKHNKLRGGSISMAIFLVLGILVAAVGGFLFTTDLSNIISYSLLGGGLGLAVITLIIYGICRSVINHKETIIYGQKAYDKKLPKLEEEVKYITHKKHGNVDPFKKFSALDKLVYLSKHLKEAKVVHAPNVNGLLYSVTLDHKENDYLLLVLHRHTFDEFILDAFICRYIKNKR